MSLLLPEVVETDMAGVISRKEAEGDCAGAVKVVAGAAITSSSSSSTIGSSLLEKAGDLDGSGILKPDGSEP